MTLRAGTRLGPYEILAPLGAGGMGEVYRARDAKLERDIAVKVLPESVAGDPEALSRFEREAKAVAALSHPKSWRASTSGSARESPTRCDFVAAWSKVMNLDRYALLAQTRSGRRPAAAASA